jgi:hypothetical protein
MQPLRACGQTYAEARDNGEDRELCATAHCAIRPQRHCLFFR